MYIGGHDTRVPFSAIISLLLARYPHICEGRPKHSLLACKWSSRRTSHSIKYATGVYAHVSKSDYWYCIWKWIDFLLVSDAYRCLPTCPHLNLPPSVERCSQELILFRLWDYYSPQTNLASLLLILYAQDQECAVNVSILLLRLRQ